MCEPSNPEKTIDGIELFFFELPKFKPKSFSEKKMQVLWLKFLTEINEKTVEVDPELFESPEIVKALDICTYLTQEEILGYDRYWDAISTAKTLASGKYKDGMDAGIEKGRAEGRAEGEKQKAVEIALNMLKRGMSEELIAEISMLSVEEVIKIKATLTA